MTGKQYDALRHTLDTEMIRASTLPTKPEQQGFVNRTFTSFYKAHQEKRINRDEYIKLINRLAAYAGGAFNDYIDVLAGAAQMGLLELAIQGEIPQFTPEQARGRSQTITDLTGVQPVDLDQEE